MLGPCLQFSTRKGEQIHAVIASSFISQEQAMLNLREIGSKDFETIKEEARDTWNTAVRQDLPLKEELPISNVHFIPVYTEPCCFPANFMK